MNLANKYRPKSFDDVVGQDRVTLVLQKMLEKGKLRQALIFSGSRGIGKTSLARIIGAELNPEFRDEVFAGVYPSYVEMDAASNGLVEDMRNLRKEVQYRSEGQQLIVLDEAHNISSEGFNVLLKLIEETPTGVYFILCTTELHKIPDTIQDRCHLFEFRKASVEALQSRLQQVIASENVVLDEVLLKVMAKKADGSYRNALMLLETCLDADITTVEDYVKIYGGPGYIFSLFHSFLKGPSTALATLETILEAKHPDFVLDDIFDVLKDILILKSGASVDPLFEDKLRIIADLSPTESFYKALRVCWDVGKITLLDKTRAVQLICASIAEILRLPEAQKADTREVKLEEIDF